MIGCGRSIKLITSYYYLQPCNTYCKLKYVSNNITKNFCKYSLKNGNLHKCIITKKDTTAVYYHITIFQLCQGKFFEKIFLTFWLLCMLVYHKIIIESFVKYLPGILFCKFHGMESVVTALNGVNCRNFFRFNYIV